jgi:hypothetical protein
VRPDNPVLSFAAWFTSLSHVACHLPMKLHNQNYRSCFFSNFLYAATLAIPRVVYTYGSPSFCNFLLRRKYFSQNPIARYGPCYILRYHGAKYEDVCLPDVSSRKLLWNVGQYLPECTMPHSRRQLCFSSDTNSMFQNCVRQGAELRLVWSKAVITVTENSDVLYLSQLCCFYDDVSYNITL